MRRTMTLAVVVAVGMLLAGCGSGTSADGARGLDETEPVASASAAASTSEPGTVVPGQSVMPDPSGTAEAAAESSAPEQDDDAEGGLQANAWGYVRVVNGCRIEPWTQCAWGRLSGAALSGANLRGANLTAASLSDANLSGADLSGAHLGGAGLLGANLSGADLSGADLTNASLTYANLSGANLSGAYLTGATWTDGRKCASRSVGSCR